MKNINGMEFADTIGVLFALKETHGHKTIQETYKLLETSEMDIALEVLHTAYNKAHKTEQVNFDKFVELLEEHNIGIIKITEAYQAVVEALMFNGMSDEEIAERKNFLMNLQK